MSFQWKRLFCPILRLRLDCFDISALLSKMRPLESSIFIFLLSFLTSNTILDSILGERIWSKLFKPAIQCDFRELSARNDTHSLCENEVIGNKMLKKLFKKKQNISLKSFIFRRCEWKQRKKTSFSSRRQENAECCQKIRLVIPWRMIKKLRRYTDFRALAKVVLREYGADRGRCLCRLPVHPGLARNRR